MRKLIVILACLSIFYAGVVWALDGCRDVGVGSDTAHHSATAMNHPGHEIEPPSHGSHSDPTKVHCPNVLNEFLISSRVAPDAPPKSVHEGIDIADLGYISLARATPHGGGVDPPGSRHSQDFPRHLLLSVLRI
jgi:hypothetical protein